MSKIFLVTSGEYSSYTVNAAFSTHEKAEAYIGEGWEQSSSNIEEFEIDAYDGFVHKSAFSVSIDLESGDIRNEAQAFAFVPEHRRSEDGCISDLRGYGDSEIHRAAFRLMNAGKQWRYGRISAMVVSYVSMDHAIKLAAEARQKWLRGNAQVSGAAQSQ